MRSAATPNNRDPGRSDAPLPDFLAQRPMSVGFGMPILAGNAREQIRQLVGLTGDGRDNQPPTSDSNVHRLSFGDRDFVGVGAWKAESQAIAPTFVRQLSCIYIIDTCAKQQVETAGRLQIRSLDSDSRGRATGPRLQLPANGHAHRFAPLADPPPPRLRRAGA
jgi:hypothetical protein